MVGVQKSQTPFGSGVFQPWPSSIPQGWTMIRAVSAARRRLGISMMPRALYENRQARTSQVGALVVDEHGRLEAGDLADRLDELGVVGQERLRVARGA